MKIYPCSKKQETKPAKLREYTISEVLEAAPEGVYAPQRDEEGVRLVVIINGSRRAVIYWDEEGEFIDIPGKGWDCTFVLTDEVVCMEIRKP